MGQNAPRKRQNLSSNQASITTFFKPANFGLSSTPLPDSVQSGLLSVGMRVRKSVPEGYKSGTYAFNNHLPSIGLPTPPSSQESVPSTLADSSRKKRPLDHEEEKEKKSQPPASINAWARSIKVPTGAAGKKKSSSFYQAIERKDIKMAGAEDFDEAEFLRPVEETEE